MPRQINPSDAIAVVVARRGAYRLMRGMQQAMWFPTQANAADPPMLARTLMFGDALSWESVTRGDVAVFSAQAAICADLLEFGVSARLLGARSLL
jgi:hypothetical protein